MYREMYRELCFYIKNINSNLDLFPDRLQPNQEGQGILKGDFKKFINEYVWRFSQGDNIVIQNNNIPLIQLETWRMYHIVPL